MTRLAGILAVLAAALLLSACGGGGDDATAEKTAATTAKAKPQIEWGEGIVEACLVEIGVPRLIALKELGFFTRAQRHHEVALIGTDRDSRVPVVVQELVPKQGGAKRWTLWVAQSAGSSLTPRQVLVREPPNSYVRYLADPSPSYRHWASRCVGPGPTPVAGPWHSPS